MTLGKLQALADWHKTESENLALAASAPTPFVSDRVTASLSEKSQWHAATAAELRELATSFGALVTVESSTPSAHASAH